MWQGDLLLIQMTILIIIAIVHVVRHWNSIQWSSYKSLTKSINQKKALGNAVIVGVSEVVFCATIEWG